MATCWHSRGRTDSRNSGSEADQASALETSIALSALRKSPSAPSTIPHGTRAVAEAFRIDAAALQQREPDAAEGRVLGLHEVLAKPDPRPPSGNDVCMLTTRGHSAASAARSSQKARYKTLDKLGILEIGPCDRNQRLPWLSVGSPRAFVGQDRLAGGKLGSDDVDRCIRGVGADRLSRRNAGDRHLLRNLQ